MRHSPVVKCTVRKTAASVGEHQIGRQSFSDAISRHIRGELRSDP